MAKIDTRCIELPSEDGAVYVVKDGEFVSITILDGGEVTAPEEEQP